MKVHFFLLNGQSKASEVIKREYRYRSVDGEFLHTMVRLNKSPSI